MKLKAFAKINLSLRVFEKRPDGFHNIESIMQSVSLCDYLTLTPLASDIQIICHDSQVARGKKNIAYKAAKLFLGTGNGEPLDKSRGKQGKGVKIEIEKNIPVAAGLAGGSADAAAVLFGLNQMQTEDSRLATPDLIKLGAEVGADVPFCLTGGTCLVQGKGEIVEKQKPWPKTYFVLVCPDLQISTKWAYQEFDQLHLNLPGEIKNDLEPAAISKYGVITEIKEKLLGLGCLEAQMSGSGPSVFGVVRHKAEAQNILGEIKDDYPRSFLVESVDQGLELMS